MISLCLISRFSRFKVTEAVFHLPTPAMSIQAPDKAFDQSHTFMQKALGGRHKSTELMTTMDAIEPTGTARDHALFARSIRTKTRSQLSPEEVKKVECLSL